jgi:two-component system catabolic regulation response regulator CreB
MTGNGVRIAVADTDRTVLELLQIRLELAGYRAFVTRSCDELIEVTRTVRPAAVLSDVNLAGGGLNGVLEQLRRRALPPVRVLAMGPSLTPEALQEITQSGIRGYIVKPFSGTDLLERVNWLMKPPAAPQKQSYYINA